MNELCQTDFGKFGIKIDKDNIKVGGRNFCVNLALYEKETSLYWLKTDEGGCELDGKDIHGKNTINMTDLAFSLLRKYYPERNTTISLLDDSGFKWEDSKGKTYKTNFLKGYLLFHGKTWYEDKFDAVMCNSDIYKLYREKADNNFDDPVKKPPIFNFINNEVKEKLEPLYLSSKTWREFINKLIEKYDKIKYKLIYDWYRSAIYTIFDDMEINQNWKIDISKRQNIICRSILQGGGKTRKTYFTKYKKLEAFYWSPSLS
jgi:hypothetical protein